MPSFLFRLNKSDFVHGIVAMILVTILGSLQQAVQTHGIDFAAYDWWGIVDVAFKAGFGYLTTKFLSDSNGKILGRIG